MLQLQTYKHRRQYDFFQRHLSDEGPDQGFNPELSDSKIWDLLIVPHRLEKTKIRARENDLKGMLTVIGREGRQLHL